MREWMRKGLAWCLAAVLLLGLLPLSPRATAAEERDLSQAEIDLDDWFYRYDKSPKEPVPTVRLDGAVVPNTDYTVSYANNTNAGQAAVTVTGTGAYFGSKTVHFTIDPRLVLPQEVTVRKCYKSFDGTTDAQPEITASSLDGPLTVTCSKASYDTPYAGTGKTVTLSGMRPSNANYTMQESDMTWNQGEIAPGIPNVKQNIQLIQGERIDLDTLVRGAGAGDVTYQFSGDSKDCVLSGSQLTAGETLGSVSLIAHIAQGKDVNGDGILDYTGGTETFSLTVVARKTQPSESGESGNGQQSLTLKGGSQVTYGKSLQFTLSGGAGSGAVRYWVEPRGSRGSATIDQSGRLTATQAGKVLVYAEKAGDATYAAAKANPIDPARPADHLRPGQNGGGRGVGPQPEQRRLHRLRPSEWGQAGQNAHPLLCLCAGYEPGGQRDHPGQRGGGPGGRELSRGHHLSVWHPDHYAPAGLSHYRALGAERDGHGGQAERHRGHERDPHGQTQPEF